MVELSSSNERFLPLGGGVKQIRRRPFDHASTPTISWSGRLFSSSSTRSHAMLDGSLLDGSHLISTRCAPECGAYSSWSLVRQLRAHLLS